MSVSFRSFCLALIAGLAIAVSASGACSARPPHVPGPRLPTPLVMPDVPPVATPAPKKKPALASRRGLLVRRITSMAQRMQGVPYVFGGTSSSGFDCSGFTYSMFALAGIRLHRMADEQYYQGKKVSAPERGDLVFFSTYLPGPSHVGISLGGRLFIHASSSSGVVISSLGDPYWSPRYIGARRFF